jgi:hypothetical protein
MTVVYRKFAIITLFTVMQAGLWGQADARSRFLPGAKHCPNEYAVWRTRQSYRWTAFALNRWSGTGQACGFTYRYSTKSRAMRGALKKCTSEEKSTNSGSRGTCIVIGVK